MAFKRLHAAKTSGVLGFEIGLHQYSCSQTIFGLVRLTMEVVRFRPRLGTTAGLSSYCSLIYSHLSSLPMSSRGTLYYFKVLANCFHPTGAGIVLRLRRRSLMRWTALDLAMGFCFNTSSPWSLHDTSGLFLRCFKRREACLFHFFGIVSKTIDSTSSDSFTGSSSLAVDSNFVTTLGLLIFR